MAGNKTVSSAVDFLAAVAGKTELFEVEPGVFVELRSLGYEESESLIAEYGDKPVALTYQLFAYGLVRPELTDEQKAELRKARPGPVSRMGSRVAELSGLGQEEGASPLAGSGSPSATAQK